MDIGQILSTIIDELAEIGPLVSMFVLLMLVMPPMAVSSTVYLWRLYKSDTRPQKSWLLRLLVIGAAIVTGASAAIAWVATRRLLGAPAIPEAVPILAVSIVFLEAVPIYYALAAWRRSRFGE